MLHPNGQDVIERRVKLVGFMPMMFDRYAGDNKTQLPVESKMYFMPDKKTLCIPAINLSSFLCAKNTTSVAKLIGGKASSTLADAMLSYVMIAPAFVPITREGNPIVFNGFINGRDEKAGIYVDYRVARLAKGIPNPKERPVLDLPWELEFSIKLFKNTVLDDTLLHTAFMRGGMALGIGTYRGLYGKFTVEVWE